jgi:hypothetical protein
VKKGGHRAPINANRPNGTGAAIERICTMECKFLLENSNAKFCACACVSNPACYVS